MNGHAPLIMLEWIHPHCIRLHKIHTKEMRTYWINLSTLMTSHLTTSMMSRMRTLMTSELSMKVCTIMMSDLKSETQNINNITAGDFTNEHTDPLADTTDVVTSDPSIPGVHVII